MQDYFSIWSFIQLTAICGGKGVTLGCRWQGEGQVGCLHQPPRHKGQPVMEAQEWD